MAEVSSEVVKKGIKLATIKDFRDTYAGGVSAQAIAYALSNDLVDYIRVGERVRVIVLTAKSLAYQPNSSPKRYKTKLRT
jgi:DNA replicative helicase MCM subunit Mcm2 (Cdc46/Mcm family)